MFLSTVQQSATTSSNIFQLDFATLIAFAALIVSVLSPLITAIINNKFSYKTHYDEFHKKPAAEAIERYLRSASALISLRSDENLNNYYKSFGEIFLYVPETLWADIEQLNGLIPKTHSAAIATERDNLKKQCFTLLISIGQQLSVETPRNKK